MEIHEPSIKMFWYLEEEDLDDFKQNFGTDFEDILVAGSRTFNRLQRYLPANEFQRIRVIFSAIVYDFKLSPVRYSNVIAMTLYATQAKQISSNSQPLAIVLAELALASKHLSDDERVRYESGLKLVAERWNEYLSSPSNFVL